ncbi:unnamed protein product [Moneuplotes crassus]|uniref:Uncharacterized protein n=1 Tax=Euplotes crassus TaxID=5936 RepID=A0AAD1X7E4_EUPCR|nr:unnamed protein product [Moneuplotes crassus]
MSISSEAPKAGMFTKVFKRLEIAIFVLNYYDYCYDAVKLWKQLNVFTRQQIADDEVHFINQISHKKKFVLSSFDEIAVKFMSHWMKYFQLEIYSFHPEAQSRFLDFLENLDSNVYPNLSVKDMIISEIKIRNELETFDRISQILLENLPLKTLINCPTLLNVKKKMFVNKWDMLEEEITKINSFEQPWVKMLTVSNYPSLNSLNNFLSELTKPVRYLNITECDLVFSHGSSIFTNNREEPLIFNERVSELLHQIHISSGRIGSSVWNDFSNNSVDPRENDVKTKTLVGNMNQVLFNILRSINFDTELKFNVNTDVYDNLPSANDDNLKLSLHFQNPQFSIKFGGTIYELCCDSMLICVKDKQASYFTRSKLTQEESKDSSITPARDGILFFDYLFSFNIKNPRVCRAVFKDEHFVSDQKIMIFEKYLTKISIELMPNLLNNFPANTSESDPLRAEIMSQPSPIPSLIKAHEENIRFDIPPHQLRDYPDIPYQICCSFPDSCLESLQSEFWDFQLISLYQIKSCSSLDIEIDKDGNAYFVKDVPTLPINKYCKELYLRVHESIDIKSTFTHLMTKFPNLRVFKFWSLPKNPKTEKYIEWAIKHCEKLEELHLKDFIWKKNILGEKA